jgi:prepilin-type N-terminal cleavage/methylation domain-containing protein
MRPIVESRLGFEDRHVEISGSGCNAKRCDRCEPVFGRDELPTAPSLRRGQVYKRASPKIEGAPKRSAGGLLIRRVWRGFGNVAYTPGRAGVRPCRLGFSLIEMLVVVTIIAAIAALITTAVMSALQQQNARVCQNNMLTIEAAKDEYIRDHPGATSIDQSAFAQYFRFGIPKCPDGGTYNNLYVLSQQVSCSRHGALQAFPSATP